MSIEVKSLRKEFGSQCAVNSISFSVTKGEIVGFLGPNGAGKSTTMKMLTGYLRPDKGTASIGGIEITKDPLGARKKIGYLAEQNALYPDLYVREYLSFIARTQQVKAINFSVAVNKSYKNSEGTKVEKTDWISAVIWKKKDASIKIADYLKKGTKVLIEGEPGVDSFIGKDGKVKKVHPGFQGPGTGEHHEMFKKEFNATIDELLKQ